MISNRRTYGVLGLVGLGAATEHLCQLMTATTTFFVTTATTALFNRNERITTIQSAHDTAYSNQMFTHFHLPALVGSGIEQGPKFGCNGLSRTKNAGTHRSNRALHNLRNLLVGQPFEFPENNRRS